MIEPDEDVSGELLKWVEKLGLSDKGLDLLKNHLAKQKVVSQLVAARISLGDGERPLVIEGSSSCLILLTLNEEKTHCYLTVIAYADEIKDLSATLKRLASARKLQLDEVTDEVLQTLSTMDFSNSTLIHEMFCQGTPAIPAKESRLKFRVRPYSNTPQYSEEEDESLNFRDLNLFQNVVADQLVAVLLPAEKGISGRDVFGQQISAGNAGARPPIKMGPGIRFEEADGYYFSEEAGMVRFEGNKIWIESNYQIRGDVDLEVGNINFVGQVSVKGDVLPDFSVNGERGIEVEGTVGGAILTAQESILLHGGILGQGKGQVKTQKDLQAKFINESTAEVEGDIVFSKEALNSRLGALGKIRASEAVIIGGKLISLGSMRLGGLGSEMGVKTEVYLGEDYRTMNKTEQMIASMEQLKEVVEHRHEELEEKITFWQMDRTKEKRDLENLDDLLLKFESFRSQLESLQATRQEFELLRQEPSDRRSPNCRVEGVVFPGTIFYCSGEVYRVKKELKGPLVIQGVIGDDGQLKIKVDPK